MASYNGKSDVILCDIKELKIIVISLKLIPMCLNILG
jgi:hypothetical protein